MSSGFQEYLIGWFKQPQYQAYYEEEIHLLEKSLPNLFGFYLVQLGRISNDNVLQASRVNHKILVDHEMPPSSIGFLGVDKIQADLDYLPIAKDCIDVMVLPHTLESAADPHYLLRQVDAMLVPEGHLVISGFSPAGYLSWSQKWCAPWVSKPSHPPVNLESAQKICEWLKVLGYDIQAVHSTSVGRVFGTQFKAGVWAKIVSSVYRMAHKVVALFGGSLANGYCLVAKKRVDSPTLVGRKWQMPRWKAVTGKLASSRASHPSNCAEHSAADPLSKSANGN